MTKMNDGTTIDISNYPTKSGVTPKDGLRYRYESANKKVWLTVDHFPSPESTYKKLTHIPENGKIAGIIKGKESLSSLQGDLAGVKSVFVWYWTLDEGFKKPLLVQIGESDTGYYTTAKNTNNWSSAGKITSENLKSRLDTENCKHNNAHTINISIRKHGGYKCTSCSGNGKQIQTMYQPRQTRSYGYCMHYLSGGSYLDYPPMSITGFKDGSRDHTGLPTLIGVQYVSVYFDSNNGTVPLLINCEKRGEYYWYRRNTSTGNTWSEVDSTDVNRPEMSDRRSNIPRLITTENCYHSIILNLSKPADQPYPGGKINITVLATPVGDTYSRFQHSLKGGQFNVTRFNHKAGSLSGIQTGIISSISAFYDGSSSADNSKLLLVERISLSIGTQASYKYYYKSTKGETWTTLSVNERAPLTGSSLKKELEEQYYARNKTHRIDLSQKGREYTCTSGRCDKMISVQPGIVENTYPSYTHTIPTDKEFKILEITYNSGPLKGDLPADLLSGVTAYFSSSGSDAILLLIELACYGNNTHKYYRMSTNDGKKLEPLSRGDDSAKLVGDNLKTELDEQTYMHTKLHRINIYEKGNRYWCKSGRCDKEIIVQSGNTRVGSYPWCSHTVSDEHGGFKVLGATDGGKALSGIPSTTLISGLTVYFSSDRQDAIPILIELELKNGGKECEYYKKEKGDQTWKLSSTSSYSGNKLEDGALKTELEKQDHIHNNIHIINVSKKDGTHGCSVSCGSQITVTPEDQVDGFPKYSHAISGDASGFRVASVVTDERKTLESVTSNDPLSKLTAYFSSKSDSMPLLVELVHKAADTHKYFTKDQNGDTWKELERSEGNNTDKLGDELLKAELHKQNCKRNKLHRICLSRNERPYSCSTGCNTQICVKKNCVENTYPQYTHSISDDSTGFRVSRVVTNGGQILEGISSNELLISVIAYFSSNNSDAIPLMVDMVRHGNTTHNYYRKSNKTDQWETLSRGGVFTPLDGKLKEELEKEYYIREKLHKIDLSHKTNKYSCKTERCDKEITVREGGKEGNYPYYVHTITTEPKGFKILDASHKQTLEGVESSKITKSLTAYFSPTEMSDEPLLIELEHDNSTYTYFHRANKREQTWRELTRPAGDKDKKLDGQLLKAELDKQNCFQNHTHGLDITRRTSDGYLCTINCGTRINVRIEHTAGKYPSYTHNVSDGSGGFRVSSVSTSNGNVLDGVTSTVLIRGLTVYFSSDNKNAIPLLVELENSDGITYQYFHRETKNTTDWTSLHRENQTSKLQNHEAQLITLQSMHCPEKPLYQTILEIGGPAAAAGAGSGALGYGGWKAWKFLNRPT